VARRPSSSSAAGEAAEDTRLIAATVAGDRRSFAELYRRHLDAVHARLTRMVGPAPERDDLVQQVFLDAYRALPRFRGDSSFSTFIHRIAINVACDHLDRRRRRRERTQPLPPRLADELVAPAESPETRARLRQELAGVLGHMEALSSKRRAAFVLVAIEGLPLDQAAALLDASVPAVRQRVLEARRQLAEALERETKEEGPR